jgi:hydroxymethylpyrimidine pyrophosphatase-like HAD family hydrolase
MTKAIYFDMDGTIANLYGVENWLPKLQAKDETPHLFGS